MDQTKHRPQRLLPSQLLSTALEPYYEPTTDRPHSMLVTLNADSAPAPACVFLLKPKFHLARHVTSRRITSRCL